MLTLLMVLRSRSRKVQGHGNGFHEKCAVAKLRGQFASNWIYRVGMKCIIFYGVKVMITEGSRSQKNTLAKFQGKRWENVDFR